VKAVVYEVFGAPEVAALHILPDPPPRLILKKPIGQARQVR
jgi:hypothetical protein